MAVARLSGCGIDPEQKYIYVVDAGNETLGSSTIKQAGSSAVSEAPVKAPENSCCCT
jgi:hypothetical protein